MSPYARTKPAGIVADPLAGRSGRPLSCRCPCAWHVFHRRPRPDAGDLGVAVQSHWFSVGSSSLGRAGVGAVATQSVAEPGYGPRRARPLPDGERRAAALRAAGARTRWRACARWRWSTRAARVAVHTGEDCIAFAGHVLGDGFGCQANMMAREGVPEAMAAAFDGRRGPLAERLVAALEGAEAAAATCAAASRRRWSSSRREGEPWRRSIDLRVEDHADPLTELRRVLVLSALTPGGRGRRAARRGPPEEAGEKYRAAAELAPESDELLFWPAWPSPRPATSTGGVDAVRRAAEANRAGWSCWTGSAEFAPAGAAVRQQIT